MSDEHMESNGCGSVEWPLALSTILIHRPMSGIQSLNFLHECKFVLVNGKDIQYQKIYLKFISIK